MNTHDIREMNWEDIQGRLEGWRERAHAALLRHGPCTTQALAEKSGIHILTLRPRVCELVQLGFAECTGHENKHGIYRALPVVEALANWTAERDRRESEARQLEMKF